MISNNKRKQTGKNNLNNNKYIHACINYQVTTDFATNETGFVKLRSTVNPSKRFKTSASDKLL